MGTVTTLPRGQAFTPRDLETMPDDGRRYELVDGTLIVTPAPSRTHQYVVSCLMSLLDRAAPAGHTVLCAPVDVVIGDRTVLQPDLLVVRTEEFKDPGRPVRPLLVVEVLSPSTRRVDTTLKRSSYEAAGCPAYWVVDPDGPSLTVWELEGDRYVERGHVVGPDGLTVLAPYEVSVVPARLLD